MIENKGQANWTIYTSCFDNKKNENELKTNYNFRFASSITFNFDENRKVCMKELTSAGFLHV